MIWVWKVDITQEVTQWDSQLSHHEIHLIELPVIIRCHAVGLPGFMRFPSIGDRSFLYRRILNLDTELNPWTTIVHNTFQHSYAQPISFLAPKPNFTCHLTEAYLTTSPHQHKKP
jgi:hypothetical protein